LEPTANPARFTATMANVRKRILTISIKIFDEEGTIEAL
jgi:hypothetical protein